MKIQGWEHTTDSRDRDLRRQLTDQARQIYDLESRLDHVFIQRDQQRSPLSRDAPCWIGDRRASHADLGSRESLQRLQEELRLTQQEVVTNAYVGSIHGGSTRGSTCGGSPPADQDSAPPDQASRDLTQAQSEVTRLSHDLRVARESIAGFTTKRDQAQHDRGNVTAERDRLRLRISDLAVEHDHAVAEWGVVSRKQTELESSIRDLSDKLKTARDAADTLNHQVSEIQGRHDRLVADHDRTFRQRDEALRQLAAVAETAGRPIRVPGAPSIPVTSAGVSVGGSGSAAVVSGSFSQASSGSAIPVVGPPGPPNHGSGSSASTSTPAPAKKSIPPGPISSGGDTAQTPAKPGADQVTETVDLTTGEIDDDGGASGEIEDDGGASGSGNLGSTGKTSAQPKGKQPIPRGFDFSSSDEDNEDDEADDDFEDSEEAEIADELLEEDTRRSFSITIRSSSSIPRHSLSPSYRWIGRAAWRVGDSDDDDLGEGPSGSGAGPAGPAGSGSPAGGSGGHHSGSPGSVSGRAGSTSPGVHPSGSSGSGARSTVPSSSGGAQGGSTSRSATTVFKSTPAPDLLPETLSGPIVTSYQVGSSHVS
ncbi:hypothetical protein PC129_g8191 [Phytophthora cactorum]|uniref:Uncharacterized protein n=1 Tax=Phytophthora cactorum TaxID=29920 RepID=A0A8T1I8S5_9STRA|nr:hypothetical protein PC119_g26410 [Phytophthora cactorum]KAG3221049.1 hypothetical protein PC129_g8191 [Phytophthora cactorum]